MIIYFLDVSESTTKQLQNDYTKTTPSIESLKDGYSDEPRCPFSIDHCIFAMAKSFANFDE